MMTALHAARLVCGRCREGQQAIALEGAAYFYHGNVFVRCEASPIWADVMPAPQSQGDE